ncbi:TonB-dependent receptor plug domain-containing protein [Silanimonas lenta]|uniref:TonB-dependent receptor plug domain-containing protein n=1 Tax=Silanimonas lenta TaxID=265429 RepID=UPI002FE37A36
MSNIKQLSGAIRFALFAGAASVLAAPAFAQNSGQQEEAKTLDRVQVTGSLIRSASVETTQPVLVITREEIQKTGLNNVFEVLNNITASDGSGLSTVTTQTNGSDGSQQISLRGLGADRTLVLVDGKRWASDIDGTVDLSTIPLAIIERIDVLKDGASAIYGSDAIAGVVNLITRKDYEGAQASAYYGQNSKGDGTRTAFDVTIGASGERSSAVIAASYSDQDPVFARDREISRWPYFGCEQAQAALPGNSACGSAFGQYGPYVVPGFGTVVLNPNANLADGITPADYVPFNNLFRYNFSPVNYLQQPAKRSNLFGYGRFDITDNVSAFVRTSYTKRTSVQQLAEVPATINASGVNGPQWAFGAAANNIYNPFGVAVNQINYRMSPLGPRRPQYDYDIFSVQAGLEGNFELGERFFNWELTAQRNDGQYDRRGTGYVNLFNLRNALGPSGYDTATGQLYCGTSFATRIPGCVPFNIFGGPTLGLGAPIPGAPAGRVITAADVRAMLNYVGYVQVATQGNTSVNYNGLLTGDLFELPGGMSGFAVGFEYRKDDVFSQPDTLVASGGSSDNFSEPTKGFVEVKEYFAEFTLPLLRDVVAAKELELSFAARKSDYSAAGVIGINNVTSDPGSPLTRKIGIRWKPLDQLLVRASYGETFRAPSVFDLYRGGGESFPQATDPCRAVNPNVGGSGYQTTDPAIIANCNAAGVVNGAPQPNRQIRSLIGGNPNLKPEQGENFTAGLVWSPEFIDNFDISLDYWRIRLTDAMATVAAGTTLQRCYNPAAPGYDPAAYCPLVTRVSNGQIAQINITQQNLSSTDTSGVDLGIAYRYDFGDFGAIRTKFDTTYIRKAEVKALASSPAGDATGFYDGSPNWEWRHNLTTDWTKGDWTVTWTARAVSRLEDIGGCFLSICSSGDPAVGNFLGFTTYHDLAASWAAPWDARIQVGARNIFGKEPPLTATTFAHSFDAAYDLPGGPFWYMSYRQNF